MKILVGSFQCESNTFAAQQATVEDFHFLYGDDVIQKLDACRVFEREGFEAVPLIYAAALPSGAVERSSFMQIVSCFMEIVSQHKDADGVYLYFHGAMFAQGIGSGEEFFVKELRKIIGLRTPISVASDFHSNISDGLIENINALSGYRTAPHTDYEETEHRAASALVRLIREKLDTKLMIFRIPVLLADVAKTGKEPYKTLIKMLEDTDKTENIVSAALYNGQPWVDAGFVGASIVLSYYGDGQKVYEAGKKMADHFSANKDKFEFDVPALSPDNAVLQANTMKRPVFISDSGDNTTAGAAGKSTFLLEKLLVSGIPKVLVASIHNELMFTACRNKKKGDRIDYFLPAADRYSSGCRIRGVLRDRKPVLGFKNEVSGEGIIINAGNCDIVITNVRTSFITAAHFSAMGLNPLDYDCVALKMGYLWPEISALAGSEIFAFTPGTSTNDFSSLEYKNLWGEYFYIKN